MKKIFFTAFIAISSFGFSQHLCGTDEMVDRSLQLDPSKKIILENLEKFTAEYIKNNPNAEKQGVTYIIPVVVHVIHNYGPENISKAQVDNAISILNEDFQRLNADTNQVVSSFKNIIADSEVEFRLARKDPNGLCTEGITRTASELTFNADDNVKSLISWPTNKYYNIWVVSKISFGAGGYAYYPGSAPQQSFEGVVCLNTQFGGIGQSGGSNFAKRTMTHETGHWLNLPHTWGSSNSCGASGNCGSDDGVGDTPNTLGNCQTCDLNRVSCGSLDNVQNYMDYTTCSKMFTNGQKNRMHAALNSSAGSRNQLWTNSNLIATGTNNGFTANCQPIADFKSDRSTTCANDSVQFFDMSYNASIDSTWTWSWSFPGASPSSSSLQNPKVIYPSPGKYNVTLLVSNSNGSDSYTRNQIIEVLADGNGHVAPFWNGIESSTFPLHPSDSDKDWIIESSASTSWHRTTVASYDSAASFRIFPDPLPDGTTHSFISPSIDFANPNNGYLIFKYAYAQKDTNSKCIFRVYVSTDCGNTWYLRYGKLAKYLATVSSFRNHPFIPGGQWDWGEVQCNVANYIGNDNLRFKFELTAQGNDNYLYIDNINIGGHPLSINKIETNEDFVSVFPNPSKTGAFDLKYILANDELVEYRIYNVLGEIVYHSSESEKSGNISKHFNLTLDKGNYVLCVFSKTISVNKKLIILD